jgi:hypothetical protein
MIAARIATMDRGRPGLNVQICTFDRAAAASMVNVGIRTVSRARKVLEKGTSELIRAVDGGKITVDADICVGGLQGIFPFHRRIFGMCYRAVRHPRVTGREHVFTHQEGRFLLYRAVEYIRSRPSLAVIEAYGCGEIELERVHPEAPHKQVLPGGRTYTLMTVARFLRL